MAWHLTQSIEVELHKELNYINEWIENILEVDFNYGMECQKLTSYFELLNAVKDMEKYNVCISLQGTSAL